MVAVAVALTAVVVLTAVVFTVEEAVTTVVAVPFMGPAAGPVGLQIIVAQVARVAQRMVILDTHFMAVTDVLDISIGVISGSAGMVSTRILYF